MNEIQLGLLAIGAVCVVLYVIPSIIRVSVRAYWSFQFRMTFKCSLGDQRLRNSLRRDIVDKLLLERARALEQAYDKQTSLLNKAKHEEGSFEGVNKDLPAVEAVIRSTERAYRWAALVANRNGFYAYSSFREMLEVLKNRADTAAFMKDYEAKHPYTYVPKK